DRTRVAPGSGSWVFDVGETLVDETPAWSAWADWLGVPRPAFFAALEDLIVRGRDHREVLERPRRPPGPRRGHGRRLRASRPLGRPPCRVARSPERRPHGGLAGRATGRAA